MANDSTICRAVITGLRRFISNAGGGANDPVTVSEILFVASPSWGVYHTRRRRHALRMRPGGPSGAALPFERSLSPRLVEEVVSWSRWFARPWRPRDGRAPATR